MIRQIKIELVMMLYGELQDIQIRELFKISF